MNKCPNCGSTAQFKISTPLYFENGFWKQQKRCGCGCIVILRRIEEIDKIEYPKEIEKISPLAQQIIKKYNELIGDK